MNKILLCTIVFAFLFSCKKNENHVITESKANTKMYFSFGLFDSLGKYPALVDKDIFYVKFYKNNSLVYNIRATSDKFKISLIPNYNVVSDCSYKFELPQLDDGTYNYEISDSLNAYGNYKNALIISNNTGKINENSTYYEVSWVQNPGISLSIGSIVKRPSFSILNCQINDTISNNNIHDFIFKINTKGASDVDRFVMFVGKTSNVSNQNYMVNYIDFYNWFKIKNNFSNSVISGFSFVGASNAPFHSGDSVYFAIYPVSAKYYESSIDYTSNPIKYNAINQKVVIGYKLH